LIGSIGSLPSLVLYSNIKDIIEMSRGNPDLFTDLFTDYFAGKEGRGRQLSLPLRE